MCKYPQATVLRLKTFFNCLRHRFARHLILRGDFHSVLHSFYVLFWGKKWKKSSIIMQFNGKIMFRYFPLQITRDITQILMCCQFTSVHQDARCALGYCMEWGLTVDISKSAVMAFNRSGRLLKESHTLSSGDVYVPRNCVYSEWIP